MKTRETGPSLLLHPQIPKPLHLLNPRTILGQAWWDVVRKEAYKRAHYKCEACGIPKKHARYHQWLEAHEIYDIDYTAGRATYKDVVALCHACHSYIHKGRLERLVEIGDETEEKLIEVLDHGRSVLRTANLDAEIQIQPPIKIAQWADWRLILAGKEYEPKFKSFAAWAKHFGYNRYVDIDEDVHEIDMYEPFMDEGGF